MSDKRSVATDALEVLGTIITDKDVGRDAIHLAVEPVIAGESILPACDLRVINGTAYMARWGETGVGIADPFIRGTIPQGSKFLLVVYPRQITSLRHVWSHPAFPEDTPRVNEGTDPMAPAKAQARADIQEIADKINGGNEGNDGREPTTVESLIEDLRSGGYVSTGWWEDYSYNDTDAMKRLRTAFTILTGELPASDDSYFSCGC